MIKIKDIRIKSDAELVTFVNDARVAIASAYVDLKTKEIKQVRAIRSLKRDIARAKTIQSERELATLVAKMEANHE